MLKLLWGWTARVMSPTVSSVTSLLLTRAQPRIPLCYGSSLNHGADQSSEAARSATVKLAIQAALASACFWHFLCDARWPRLRRASKPPSALVKGIQPSSNPFLRSVRKPLSWHHSQWSVPLPVTAERRHTRWHASFSRPQPVMPSSRFNSGFGSGLGTRRHEREDRAKFSSKGCRPPSTQTQ